MPFDFDMDSMSPVESGGGGSANIESLSVTPSTSSQTITASGGVDGYSPVNVSAVTSSIDANIVAGNIKKDVQILGVTGTLEAGGDFQPTRVKDDSNNEIGTHICNFTDANGNTFKVVVLDAQYRKTSTQWCSDRNTVTNMPMYNSNYDLWWYDNAMETATQNTQLILDYCTAQSATSTACTHCRSNSFTIDGTTYYGQLPNMREVLDMWRHRVQIEQMDTSASSHSSTNFSSARTIWSSSQYNNSNCWYFGNRGTVNNFTKTNDSFTCPVLEIPV